MALELGDQIVNETGSGNDVLVDLDTPLDPAAQDAALVLICHEPFYLADTYYLAPPTDQTRHKHIEADVLLPDESDLYYNRSMAPLGFGEYRYLAFARGSPNVLAGVPRADGLPGQATLVLGAPNGFRAEAFLVAPDPDGDIVDQLLIHFERVLPRTANDVDWFAVKAWHLLNFNPDHESLLGTAGTRNVEPTTGKYQPSSYDGSVDPPFLGYSWHYCSAIGEVSVVASPPDAVFVGDGLVDVEVVPDGGDVGGGGSVATVNAHMLDVALAGRWGDPAATGTYTWTDDYPHTLLDTVDRTQPDGNHAHIELFYRILDPPGPSTYSADGTFGPQTVAGLGDDMMYRWTGGLLRAAAIESAVKAGGGWMPQIYRRMIEVETG